MAIPSYIGVVNNTSTGATSVTPNIGSINGGSAPAVGDLILACLTLENASDTSDENIHPPDGYHRYGGAWNTLHSQVFWKIWESGDDTTPTFSWSASRGYSCATLCIRGVDPARPFARQSIRRYTSGTMAGLAETTPVADCLGVSIHCSQPDRSGVSAPSGWTERSDIGAGFLGLSGTSQQVCTQGFATSGSSTGTASTGGGLSTTRVSRIICLQPSQTPAPKDIRVKTGSTLSPTSTGNQDITGLGFDCKALIVYCVNKSADSVSANIEWMRGIGADDGTNGNVQRAVGAWHTSGGSNEYGYTDSASIFKMYFSGSSTLGSPDLEASYSRITDGFRLNWTTVQGSGVAYNWIAFGGADFEAVVGAEQVSTSPVTGLPWRPDLIHQISQLINSDTDQLRTTGAASVGWIDAQAAAVYCVVFDVNGSGTPNFLNADFAFDGEVNGGAGSYAAELEQITSDGWAWNQSNTDYFYYLAMYFGNNTAFPYAVESVDTDTSGTTNATQNVPIFAQSQTYAVKQVILSHVTQGSVSASTAASGYCEGHVEFDGGQGSDRDQDSYAIAKTGSTSERRRKTAEAFCLQNSGDLDSPGKVGKWTAERTITWTTNNTTRYLMGLTTIGFIGQVYTRTVNDSVSVSDSIGVQLSVGRTLSDSVSVSDSVSSQLSYARALSDSVSVSDSFVRAQDVRKLLSDALSLTDALAIEVASAASDTITTVDVVITELVIAISITDSVAVADAVALTVEVSVDDAVSTADLIAFESIFTRSATDAVVLSDQVALEVSTSLDDSVLVADTVASALDIAVVRSDTVSVVDALALEESYARTVFDAIDVNDSLAIELSISISVSDSVAISDAIATALVYGRVFQNFISLVDQISIELASAAGDTVGVADELGTELTIRLTVSDTVTVADTVSVTRSRNVTLDDSVTVADAVLYTVTFERARADTVTASDSVSVALDFSRLATDSVATVDTVATSLAYARATSDSVSVDDVAALTIEASVTDSIAVVDAVSTARVVSIAVDDVALVSDAVTTELSFLRTLNDTVSSSDTVTVVEAFSRALSDAVSAADSVLVERTAVVAEGDTVSVVDALTPSLVASRAASDVVDIVDAVTAALVFTRAVSDAVGVSDELARVVWFARSADDALVVTDEVSASRATDVTASDSVAVADQLVVTRELERTQSDAISATDAVTRVHVADRTLSDSIATSDTASSGVEKLVSASDAIDVADTLVVALAFARQTDDGVSVADTLSREHDASRTTADAIATVDALTVGVAAALQLSDAIALDDLLAVALAFNRSTDDAVSVADAIDGILSVSFDVSLSDTASTSDSVEIACAYARDLSDAVTLTELVEIEQQGREIDVSDALIVVDTLARSLEVDKLLSDSLAASDSLGAVRVLGGGTQDVIAVGDSIAADILKIGTDVLITTDLLRVVAWYVRGPSDSVVVEDSANEGEIIFVPYGVDADVGPIIMFTVENAGPLSISGGPELSTGPVGFIANAGNFITITDQVVSGLTLAVELSDSVGATG